MLQLPEKSPKNRHGWSEQSLLRGCLTRCPCARTTQCTVLRVPLRAPCAATAPHCRRPAPVCMPCMPTASHSQRPVPVCAPYAVLYIICPVRPSCHRLPPWPVLSLPCTVIGKFFFYIADYNNEQNNKKKLQVSQPIIKGKQFSI